MADVRWDRYPSIGSSPRARAWLTIQANLGLAANTIEAYGRALEDYLRFSRRGDVDLDAAGREHVAAYVRDLADRPNPRGRTVRVLDSGVGLANATLQQRLTAVRLYYDYLIEEGVRPDNPVGRGRYTPGKGFAGQRDRGLIPRYRKLPWIPDDEQWQAILNAARQEPIRNRMMLALAYDAALRREELCAIHTGDVDPARRQVRIRSEATKTRRERVVPYSRATGARPSSASRSRPAPRPTTSPRRAPSSAMPRSGAGSRAGSTRAAASPCPGPCASSGRSTRA